MWSSSWGQGESISDCFKMSNVDLYAKNHKYQESYNPKGTCDPRYTVEGSKKHESHLLELVLRKILEESELIDKPIKANIKIM